MFITNDISPGEMLAELLRGRRVSREYTQTFADLAHDKHLCPQFKKQLSIMLDVYRAYGTEVHDIQSMRDDGIDVLLKYHDRDENERRAGLQIKSEDEFRQWEAKKLPLIQILKAQYASACENGRLNEYYLVLCVDAKRHQKRIRSICAELKNFKSLKIVEPEDLVDFYGMSHIDLWARVIRLLCHNDTVLNTAIEETESEEPDIAFFIVDLVCCALGGERFVNNEYLSKVWFDWILFSDQLEGAQCRFDYITNKLSSFGIIEYENNRYELRINELPIGVCALYFDLCVRASYSRDEMRSKIISLVDLASRLTEKRTD